MPDDDDIAPPGAEIARINDEAVGGHVDRVAQVGIAAADAVPVFAKVPIRAEAARLVVALAVFEPARQREAVGQPDGGRVIGKEHAAREPKAHETEPGGHGVEKPAHTGVEAMPRRAGSASVRAWWLSER